MPKKKILIRSATEIGWLELVELPELGLKRLPAKIDTGANTSAIHAENISVNAQDGADWVSFNVPDIGEDSQQPVVAKIVSRRKITNTSGVPEERIIICTTLALGGQSYEIELSLADRGNMKYPIIIGRSAIRNRGIIVNPSRSNLNNRKIEIRRSKKA
ncbi:MAG: RimK/LysX family protein [Ahrensia sp.]|nr:RimK/LysX family protein [Ahrensia sp.]